MREIKFRAWDIVDGVMWEWPALLTSGFKLLNDPAYNFMQYTGLKDKNGKEIYEGDIVKIDGGGKPTNCQVDFEDGCFTIHAPWIQKGFSNPELKYYCGFKEEFIAIQIIGNIYENPELLKE